MTWACPPDWVIVITGSGDTDLLRARQAGAEIVLIKPVDWSVLISRIRSVCQDRLVTITQSAA
jgi:hypothetical protein